MKNKDFSRKTNMKLWVRDKLRTIFNYPSNVICSEVWVISTHKHEENTVSNGK